MANHWGSTTVSDWVISGSNIVVTVNVRTEDPAPQIFVTLRSNTVPSSFPALDCIRVKGMAQAGFIAETQSIDGTIFTKEMLSQADLHLDYLVHE